MTRPLHENPGRYLWFNRGGMRFAAAMENLQEVLPLQSLRTLPVSERALMGLIVVRNLILPVFDPALLSGEATVSMSGQKNVVVLRLQGIPTFAVAAEGVGQVVALPAPGQASGSLRIPSAFLGEVKLTGNQRLLVLNPAGLAATMGLACQVSPSIQNGFNHSPNQLVNSRS